jgi:PKD repeat protein
MKKSRFACSIVSFLCVLVAQTAVAQFDFTLASSYCINQNVSLSASNAPYSNVEWDFCVQRFSDNLEVEVSVEIPGGERNLGMDFIKHDGTWYGVVTSWSGNKLFRLAFTNGLNNPPTAVVDLGNPGGLLNQPVSIGLVRRNGIVYALVQNWGNSSLVRIKFDDGITGVTRSANTVYSTFGSSMSKMEIIDNALELKAIAVTSDAKIHVVDFQNNIDRSITTGDVLKTNAVNGISDTREIEMVKENGNWYAFIASFGVGTVARIDFGTDIMTGIKATQLVVTNNIYDNGFIDNLEILRNGKEFHLHVATYQGNLYKVNLGENITTSGIITGAVSYGGSGGFSQGYAMKFVRDNAEWNGFIMNDIQSKLYSITNGSECHSSLTYSDNLNPKITYSADGNFPISLVSYDMNGNSETIVKSATVVALAAPTVDFAYQNMCAQNDVTFTPQNGPNNIVTYSWNFDDSTTPSTDINPVHQFASAGEYDVSLEITASNTCSNRIVKTVKIYTRPTASFTLPGGLLCTNNEFMFENTTSDVYEGHLEYQWYVDNTLVSTSRNLTRSFDNTGAKTIKLRTSIPGCGDDEVQTTSSFQAGPSIDFSVLGSCEDAIVRFGKIISEPVTQVNWNFDDGASSNQENPDHAFENAGVYSVQLIATSLSGCNNSKTKTVSIYSRPIPDFSIHAPPQSCSGSATPFVNATPSLSDSEINSWRWNFGDANSATNLSEIKTPTHTFMVAGNYTIELKAKSTKGCESVLQKQISIAQSPIAEFSNSATCLNAPATFTASANNLKSYYWEVGTSYYLTSSTNHTFNSTGEQPVKLTVTGDNLCTTSVTRKVSVPIPLEPTFSVWKNCVGYETEFKDITTGADPIAWRQWKIGTTVKENVGQLTYTPTGTEPIATRLTVKGQSGCQYSKDLIVPIWKAPVAKFTVSPVSGAIPLRVEVDNQSSEASDFSWSFHDGTITNSNGIEPYHVFVTTGEHAIELKARNAVGCESTSSKMINAEIPAPDVQVKLITLSQNPDKTLKAIVTLQNDGNTIINDLPVKIDLSGGLLLRETVRGPLLPDEQYNLVLSYGITKSQDLEFLCAETDLANDLVTTGNRSCIQFEKKPLILTSYPNPVTDILNIEWISTVQHKVNIVITDGFGKALLQKEIDAAEGLNQQYLDVHDLKAGIYFLVINDGSTIKTQRILISAKN